MSLPSPAPEDDEPLTLQRRGPVEALLEATRSPLSEYSFANLYLFRARHKYRLLHGEAPAILGVTYDGERHALPLSPLTAATAAALLRHADCIYPIEEGLVARAQALGLQADWREADADYVYDRARLATLEGARTRRQQADRFAESWAPRAEPLVAANRQDAHAILQGWMADTGRKPGETDDGPCEEALEQLDPLDLHGLLVRTGEGAPVAFLIASRGPSGSTIVHFAKGRRAYAGVYAWMFARFAESATVAELNFEQDLGNRGFAQSKAAFAPAAKRRKYRLRWNQP